MIMLQKITSIRVDPLCHFESLGIGIDEAVVKYGHAVFFHKTDGFSVIAIQRGLQSFKLVEIYTVNNTEEGYIGTPGILSFNHGMNTSKINYILILTFSHTIIKL